MLNVFRENLKHLKPVLWLVAISMVLYLGYYFIETDSTVSPEGWAAKVGDEVVSADEFLQEARRRDDFYRRMLGNQYEQMKPQIRLGEEVIHSLINRRIAIAEANKLGLAATKAEVARRITEDPNFRDASGNFVGKERYAEIVRSNYGNERAFEQLVAEDLTVEKWFRLVSEPASVSDAELERAYRSRNERAAVDYVFVPSASQRFSSVVSPSEAEAWYGAHPEAYRRGEARRLKVLVVDRESRMESIQIAEADIEAYYRENAAQLQRPERRRSSHILFAVPAGAQEADRRAVRELAESVAQRARGGEDFAELARTLSQDPDTAPRGGDLGYVTRGQREPVFDRAIFETAAGQIAPVFETSLGFHVLRVEEVQPAGPTPLAEVRDAIVRVLQVRRADEAVTAEADGIRSSVTDAAQLAAAAAERGGVVEEWTLVRDEPASRYGASPEFVQAAFQAAPGGVAGPARVTRGLAVAVVEEALPPAVPPLGEILDRVKNDVVNDRAKKAAVDAARSAVAASGTLAAAAKRLGLEVRPSGDLSPGQSLPGAGASPEFQDAVFGTGASVGKRGVVTSEGGAVAYEITRLDVFDPARFREAIPALRQELLRQRRDALLQSLFMRLRTEYAVEWNRELVERANG